MAADGSGTDQPWLFLGQGWTWDDKGRWIVTPRAMGNADFMAGRRGDAKRGPWRAHDPIDSAIGAEGWRPHNLPVVIVCPFCSTPQRLEPTLLAIGANQHEHRVTGRVAVGGGVEMVLCCNAGRDRGYVDAALLRKRLGG